MKYLVKVIVPLAILSLLVLHNTVNSGTVGTASLSPDLSVILTGAFQPLTFSATNDKTFDIKTYHVELSFTAGLSVTDIVTTPPATKATVDTRKKLIIFEWSGVGTGTTVTGGFTVSSNVQGAYSLSPSSLYYTDYNRQTSSATCNSAVISVRSELVPPSPPTDVRSTSREGFVDVAWSASPDSDVVSYNIYRATADGNYTLLGSASGTAAYTDASVQSGNTYFYKVATVDGAGNESYKSMETAITYVGITFKSISVTETPVTAMTGDINGDGKPDLILGFPNGYSGGSGKNATYGGYVVIFYGDNTTDVPDVTIYNPDSSGRLFGYSLAVVDLNKDGYDDLIIGEPHYDIRSSPVELVSYGGRVYVYAGGPQISTTPAFKITGNHSYGCEGTQCGYYLYISEQLGYSIAAAGDVNGDGYQDVVIGAPYGGHTLSGKILVLFGGQNLSALASAGWSGAHAYQYMGSSVASAGDVNEDGYSDIIAGAPSFGAPAFGSPEYSSYPYGSAYLFIGGPSVGRSAAFSTGVQKDGFGITVSSVGDMNGDGYSDIYVGGKSMIAAYVYYGSGSPDTTADVFLTDNIDFTTSIGDVDKDGIEDMLVSPGPRIYYGNNVGDRLPDITRDGMRVIAANDADKDGIKEFITYDQNQKIMTLNTLGGYAGIPSIALQTPQSDSINTKSLHILISGRVSPTAVRLEIRGQDVPIQADGSFSADVPLDPTVNVLEISAINAEGKRGKRVLTVSYTEPTPLTLSITSPADGAVLNTQETTVMGTVSDSSARVTVNGVQAVITGNNFSAAGVVLQEGPNTVTATAQDNFDQTATQSISVTLVTKGTITGTVTDSTTGLPLSGVSVTVIDPQSTHTAATDSNGSYTVSDVTQGNYLATFSKIGYVEQNISSALTAGETKTLNIQLAPKPPLSIAITSPQEGAVLNAATATVTGTVSNNATVTVNGSPATVSNGAFTASVSLTERQNTITASATDSYGQTASHSITVTLLTKGTITGTVTDSTGTAVASAAVTVTDSLSIVQTVLADADGNYTIPNVTQGQFSGTITKNDYSIYSFSGSMTAGQTMTVNGSITLLSPIVSTTTVMGRTLDSVTIVWTTDQATDGLVEYGTSASYGSSVSNAVLITNHSIMLTDLVQGTAYHFRVTSTNSHGLSSSSQDAMFTTAAPPTISDVQVTNIATDSATITWATDQPSSGSLDYGTTASYGNLMTDPTMTTNHSITLTGLSERTKYHFRVTSVNADGIAAQTGDKTLWTHSSVFSATTLDDYGNATVMEVVGNYNATNPDGTINDLPRQEIAKEFFRTHQDDYDFLVIFSNFDFAMPDVQAQAFYMGVKNDTQGIGLQQFDSSAFFGSSGKLQGMIDMGNLTNLGVSPGTAGFDETLSTLSHEFLHRWGAGVKFRAADGSLSTALLGRDGTHWSYLLDAEGSVLYGNDWQANSDGTFTSVSVGNSYSPLDLYLMGLYDRSQVPPMTLIENTAIDPATLPQVGATVSGTVRTVTIDNIIAAEGERIPGAAESQKAFKVGYILITTPNTFTGTETAGIENIRSAWAGRFASLTGGKGSIADVTPSLTVSITSPANGSTITGENVTVSGAIINTTGDETGVTVNGVPATVYGSRFIANNVSLIEGTNTLTVTATDATGNTTTTTNTVTGVATGSYIELTPVIEAGISPLTVTFTIDGSVSFTSSQMTVSGPGSVEWLSTSIDAYTAKITGDGAYIFTARVTTADGTIYEDSTVITVLSRMEMDRLLKAKWEGMKTKLTSQDVDGAAGYFGDATKEKYRGVFTLLRDHLPTIEASMQEIKMDYVKNDVAEYRIRRIEQINGQDMEVTYFLYFVKDGNGLWKIESM